MQKFCMNHLPLDLLCNLIRDTHTHTHGYTPTSSPKLAWAFKCTSGSCRSMEVIRQVPLATHSDCEILFLHCLPPEFRIRMSLHSSPLRDLFSSASAHVVEALIFTWRPVRKGKNSLIYQFISLYWDSIIQHLLSRPKLYSSWTDFISFGKSNGT